MLLKELSYCIAEQLSAFFLDKEFETASGKVTLNVSGYSENVVYRWSHRKKGSTNTMLITSISNLDVYLSSMNIVAENITLTAVENECDYVVLSDKLTLPPDVEESLSRYSMERTGIV